MKPRALLVGVLLAAGAVHAQTYLRTQMANKQLCIYWGVRSYLYQPDAAGYSQLPVANLYAAYVAAFQSWQSLSDWCSGFQFTSGPAIQNAMTGYLSDGGTNTNVIIVRESSCALSVSQTNPCWQDDSCANQYRCWIHADGAIALTTATYSTTTGVILDADIELNAAPHVDGSPTYLFTTVDSPVCPAGQPSESCVSTDVQNTLTHEIGHVIGLAHVPNPDSTMYASAQAGELRKRIIDSGTAQGFCDIYPRAQPSTADCFPEAQESLSIVGTTLGTTLPTFGCGVGPRVQQAGMGGGLLLVALGGVLLILRERNRQKR